MLGVPDRPPHPETALSPAMQEEGAPCPELCIIGEVMLLLVASEPKKDWADFVFHFFFFHMKLAVHSVNQHFLFFFLRGPGKLTGFSIFSSFIGLALFFLALTKQYFLQVHM